MRNVWELKIYACNFGVHYGQTIFGEKWDLPSKAKALIPPVGDGVVRLR